MPLQLTAQSYELRPPQISLDQNNNVTGYKVDANITFSNGGNPHNIVVTFDLWSVASAAQKAQVQAIQDLVKAYLDNQILGGL